MNKNSFLQFEQKAYSQPSNELLGVTYQAHNHHHLQ